MKRVDVIEIDDDGSEQLSAGIVLFDGKLQWAEGSRVLVENVLEDRFVIPDGNSIKQINGERYPELWLEWAPGRLSSSRMRIDESYEDDDSLYSPITGEYVGDRDNRPIPDA